MFVDRTFHLLALLTSIMIAATLTHAWHFVAQTGTEHKSMVLVAGVSGVTRSEDVSRVGSANEIAVSRPDASETTDHCRLRAVLAPSQELLDHVFGTTCASIAVPNRSFHGPAPGATPPPIVGQRLRAILQVYLN
jgi:hypothetical protein